MELRAKHIHIYLVEKTDKLLTASKYSITFATLNNDKVLINNLMKKFLTLATLLLISWISNPTYAQLLSTTSVDNAEKVAKSVFIDGLNEEDWAVFADEDNRRFYIDLEKLHIYLDKITVTDEKHNIVFTDNLWNLSANTIYELDLSQFKAGNYQIEFSTLTDEKYFKNFEIK